MKTLTGLPTSSYLRVAERLKVSLEDLLKLVLALESGLLPAYIARYRPDISAGLDVEDIQDVLQLLNSFLDLEDRRITVLATLRQKNQLTTDLRAAIEDATERQTVEDLYLPFRAKQPSVADQALGQGLKPLANFLWNQDPLNADIEAVARKHVNPEEGVSDVRTALAGARHIVARRLAEEPRTRGALRRICFEHTELRVYSGEARRTAVALRKKVEWLKGYRSPVEKVGWRQYLALRRGVREGLLRSELVLPENRVVSFMLDRLLQDRSSLFCSHLGVAACIAYRDYLVPALTNDVVNWLADRSDTEALRGFKKNLRKILLAPPAGRLPTIGLEIGKPGGWRAAVVGADGSLLAAAIVHSDKGEIKQKTGIAATKPQITETEATKTQDDFKAQEPTSSDEILTKTFGVSNDESTLAGAEQVNLPTVTCATVIEAELTESQPTELAAGDTSKKIRAVSSLGKLEAEALASGSVTQGELPDTVTSKGETLVEEMVRLETGAAGNSENGDGVQRDSQTESSVDLRAKSSENLIKQRESRARACRPSETPHGSLSDLIREYQIEALVVVKGPNIKQNEKIIRGELRQSGASDVIRSTVNAMGSWIYATSRAGREEFPNVDPAVRSAISLARRFQDPLVESVKLDPRLLGIGQFFNEIESDKLRDGLRQTVEVCVHEVGVDLNNASQALLGKLPGVTERLAKRIVAYREKEGKFSTRDQLKKVPGINDRLYKQLVGFTRVLGGEQLLDTTGVHPDWYSTANKIIAAADISMEDVLGQPEALKSVNLEKFETKKNPRLILDSIVRELTSNKPDSRTKFIAQRPKVVLLPTEALKVGLETEGSVTNITNFGAFVDIGADQEGLIHLSQIADKFREDGHLSIKPGDLIRVRVLSVHNKGDRISLTTLDRGAMVQRSRDGSTRSRNGSLRPEGPRKNSKHSKRTRRAVRQSFGPDRAAQTRETERISKLSIDEKFSLLETKYRTKI